MARRDDRGMVLPTRLLALSISAVAAAALVYIVNDPDQSGTDTATPTVATKSPGSTAPTATATPSATPTKAAPKPIKRSKIMVEIFNNTRTKGMAGRTAGTASAAGWKVIGTDNWYGTVDATTVYYPPKLEAAARALGRDLGIHKVRPAEDPMHFDRITVILTDDYRG